jgi:hypothetical protein
VSTSPPRSLHLNVVEEASSLVGRMRKLLQEDIARMLSLCGKPQDLGNPQKDLVATALLRGQIQYAQAFLDLLSVKRYIEDGELD